MHATPALRSRHEIDGELFRLYGLGNLAPGPSVFGDNNLGAIRTQIAVLREEMTPEQVVERYEDADDYILCAALDAAEWLHGDAPAPSDGWHQMATQRP